MTKNRELYRCPICGNIVQILHAGAILSCCGKPMEKIEDNTSDGANEKHVPIIEMIDNMVHVKIGRVEHPMTKPHHIQWIELECSNGMMRKELQPSDQPEAFFPLPHADRETSFFNKTLTLTAQAYCNLHGLWTATISGSTENRDSVGTKE